MNDLGESREAIPQHRSIVLLLALTSVPSALDGIEPPTCDRHDRGRVVWGIQGVVARDATEFPFKFNSPVGGVEDLLNTIEVVASRLAVSPTPQSD
jgi:hypothetical protein